MVGGGRPEISGPPKSIYAVSRMTTEDTSSADPGSVNHTCNYKIPLLRILIVIRRACAAYQVSYTSMKILVLGMSRAGTTCESVFQGVCSVRQQTNSFWPYGWLYNSSAFIHTTAETYLRKRITIFHYGPDLWPQSLKKHLA